MVRDTHGAQGLLRLPLEIHLLIIAQSDDTSLHYTLGFTCRTLYPLTKLAPSLSWRSRESLGLLLEKGWGSRCYYCHICSKLHPFSPQDGPLTPHDAAGIHNDNFFCLILGKYTLRYHHARLVMNRHFYGAPSGLPLESLGASDMEMPHSNHSKYTKYWRHSFSAKIVDGELFLRAKQAFSSEGMSSQDLTTFFRGHHRERTICQQHIDGGDAINEMYRDWREWSSDKKEDTADQLLEKARTTVKGCHFCLVDYSTKIEQTVNGKEETFRIKIISYYRIGDARSPSGWNWGAKYGRLVGHRVPPRTMHLRDTAWPIGSVRDKWLYSAARNSHASDD